MNCSICFKTSDLLPKGSQSPKLHVFWGIFSLMWVGGVADSQTRSKPLKPPQIAPKIAFFDPNFTFPFPKSHKNPEVGGWVNRFGKDFPKKKGFFLAASLILMIGILRHCTVGRERRACTGNHPTSLLPSGQINSSSCCLWHYRWCCLLLPYLCSTTLFVY